MEQDKELWRTGSGATGKAAGPSENREFAPGDQIAERFTVVEKVGGGGMSVVYKCLDANGSVVGLKFLKPQLAAEERLLLRFQQEAKAIARLEHPNIIRIHQFVSQGSAPYIVMDFVEGNSLADVLVKEGSLEVPRCLGIMMQVADALAHAHAKGIVHRDLKPSNIMLVEKGHLEHVKILDFGIAKVAEGEDQLKMTQTGEIFGSPAYMSPEQSLGKKVDARSDQYSLGCVMFECLTGCPPFVGVNAVDTVMHQIHYNPPSLKEASLGKTFKPELEQFVARILMKDPDQRYASMSDAQKALQEVLTPPNTLTKVARKVSKSDLRALRLGVLIGTAAGAVLCFLVMYGNWVFRPPSKSDIVEHKAESGKNSTAVAPSAADRENQLFTRYVNSHLRDTELSIHSPVITAPGFAQIPRLTNLRLLRLQFCPTLTDKDTAGFENLTHLTELSLGADYHVGAGTMKRLENLPLEVLDLRRTAFNDDGARSIAKIKTLRRLDLSMTFVTNTGLKMLADGLPELAELNLTDCPQLTDRGVAFLKGANKLRLLNLDTNRRIGACIPALSHMQLNHLKLDKTAVRDTDLTYLSGMPLHQLDLNSTGITDEGLRSIAKMPFLEHLEIAETPDISPRAIERLQKERPKLKIINDQQGQSDSLVRDWVKTEMETKTDTPGSNPETNP